MWSLSKNSRSHNKCHALHIHTKEDSKFKFSSFIPMTQLFNALIPVLVSFQIKETKLERGRRKKGNFGGRPENKIA